MFNWDWAFNWSFKLCYVIYISIYRDTCHFLQWRKYGVHWVALQVNFTARGDHLWRIWKHKNCVTFHNWFLLGQLWLMYNYMCMIVCVYLHFDLCVCLLMYVWNVSAHVCCHCSFHFSLIQAFFIITSGGGGLGYKNGQHTNICILVFHSGYFTVVMLLKTRKIK